MEPGVVHEPIKNKWCGRTNKFVTVTIKFVTETNKFVTRTVLLHGLFIFRGHQRVSLMNLLLWTAQSKSEGLSIFLRARQ